MRIVISTFFVVALSACSTSEMRSYSAVPNVPYSASRLAQYSPHHEFENVETGAATDSYALQDLDFYPNKITIDAGDTITYRVNGAGLDGHTVTFVPPKNSIPGPLNLGTLFARWDDDLRKEVRQLGSPRRRPTTLRGHAALLQTGHVPNPLLIPRARNGEHRYRPEGRGAVSARRAVLSRYRKLRKGARRGQHRK